MFQLVPRLPVLNLDKPPEQSILLPLVIVSVVFATYYYQLIFENWFIGTEKYHGVILFPEGLIESIPEVYALLQVTNVYILDLKIKIFYFS